MSEGFAYTDILILALVAGFILLRLRNILGQHPELPERKLPAEKAVPTSAETALPPVKVPAELEDETPYLAQNAPGLPGRLQAIRKADPSFRASSFLSGAKIAFEMILDAFAKGDRKALKPLLSPAVLEHFMGEIRERKAGEAIPETTLIAITTAEIIDADMHGSTVRITVRFVSDQVHLLRDAQGAILEGDPSAIEQVTDVWTFERDARANDPNWKLAATQE